MPDNSILGLQSACPDRAIHENWPNIHFNYSLVAYMQFTKNLLLTISGNNQSISPGINTLDLHLLPTSSGNVVHRIQELGTWGGGGGGGQEGRYPPPWPTH